MRQKLEYLTLRIERDADGAFGLHLNDHNRINEVKPGSPAAKAKLKPFDRIIMVDGVEVKGKISELAKGRHAMLLRVERPPSKLFNDICKHENAEDSLPYQIAKAEHALCSSPAAAESSRPELDGLESITVILSRDDGNQFGLEVHCQCHPR